MLHTLRNKLAVLCPETDGLQRKYRIKYVPNGRTCVEKLGFEPTKNTVDKRGYWVVVHSFEQIERWRRQL